jgi:hypothetical protein
MSGHHNFGILANLKGPCNVFFIIAIERLHVQKDILQITLIISTDKYEKKNKKSVFQTAPPPWRNLIYINILHNCDVRFRSRRQAEQPHARLPTVAQRVITRISTTNLQKIFRQPGGLLQAVATHVRMAPVCIIPPQKIKRSIGDFGRQN